MGGKEGGKENKKTRKRRLAAGSKQHADKGDKTGDKGDKTGDKGQKPSRAFVPSMMSMGTMTDKGDNTGDKGDNTGDKGQKPSRAFVVDVSVSDPGRVLTTLDTCLESRCLAKPLADALIAPAVQAFANQSGRKFAASSAALMIGGRLVDRSDKVSTYLPADESEPTRVHLILPRSTGWGSGQLFRVHLTSPSGEALTKPSGEALTKPSGEALTNPSGEAHHIETRLGAKWLERSLVDAIIKPALASLNMRHVPASEVVAYVHGDVQAADISRATRTFIDETDETEYAPVAVRLVLPLPLPVQGTGSADTAGLEPRKSLIERVQGAGGRVQGTGLEPLKSILERARSAVTGADPEDSAKQEQPPSAAGSSRVSSAAGSSRVSSAMRAVTRSHAARHTGSVHVALADPVDNHRPL